MHRSAPLLVLLAGCLSTPDPAPPLGTRCIAGSDVDGDGWLCDGPVADCDDEDENVHPGAIDTPGDGVNGDCLGGDSDAEDMLAGVVIDDSLGFAIVTEDFRIPFHANGSLLPSGIVTRSTGVDFLDGDGLSLVVAPGLDTATATGTLRTIFEHGPAMVGVLTQFVGTIDGVDVDGYTYLMVTPDSRFARIDELAIDGAITNGPYTASTVTRMSASPFQTIDWSTDDLPIEVATADGELWSSLDDYGWGCFSGFQGSIGMTWAVDADNPDIGPRIAADRTGGTLTLAFDVPRDAPTIEGGTIIETTWQLSVDDNCALLEDVATELMTPPLITTSGGTVEQRPGQTPAYRFRADLDHIEMTFQDQPPHAGMLFTGVFPEGDTLHGITVWRNGVRLQNGIDYLTQREIRGTAEPEVYVWFPDLLLDRDVDRTAAFGGEPI